MEVTDTTFNSAVLQATEPVLVDFWASWCPPCKMMEPVVDRLASQTVGHARVVKVNIDRNPNVAGAYDIDAVPSFVAFRNGRVIAKRTGALTIGQLQALLDQATDNPS